MGFRRLATFAVVAFFVAAPAASQQRALTPRQTEAVAAYDKALAEFKSILAERRRQIDAKEPLPNLPGQALYLARRRDQLVQGSHRCHAVADREAQ